MKKVTGGPGTKSSGAGKTRPRPAGSAPQPSRAAAPRPKKATVAQPAPRRDDFKLRRAPTGSSLEDAALRAARVNSAQPLGFSASRLEAANKLDRNALAYRHGDGVQGPPGLPTFSESVAESRAAEVNALAQTDPAAAVQQARETLEDLPAGAQRDDFVGALGPTFEAAGGALATQGIRPELTGGAGLTEDLAAIAEISGRQTEIAEAVAFGIGPDRSLPPAAGSASLSAGARFLSEVRSAHAAVVTEAQALAEAGALEGAEAAAAIAPAVAAAEAAQAEVAALDAQLSNELALLGPGIDDATRVAFVESFHADHAESYENEARTAEALAEVLSNPALDAAAATDPGVGAVVAQGLERLATSSRASEALEVLGAIGDRPGSALAAQLQAPAVSAHLQEHVLEAAIVAASGDALADAGGDVTIAATDLTDLVGKALRLFPDVGEGLGLFVGNLNKLAEGDIAGAITGFGSRLPGQLGNAFAAAGLVLAGAASVGTAHERAFADTLAALSRHGANGIKIFTRVVNGIAQGGSRYAANYAGVAASSTQFAARFVPLLSLVSASASLFVNAQSLREDPGVGEAVTALGSAVRVVGGVLQYFPPAAAAGALIVGAGTFIEALGGLIDLEEDHAELRASAEARLVELGFDGPLANALAQNAGTSHILAGSAGLSPQQIQALYTEHPGALEHLGALAEAAALGSAPGERFLELVDRLEAEAGGDAAAFDDALAQLTSSDNLHLLASARPDERAHILGGLLNVHFPETSSWYGELLRDAGLVR